MQDQPHPFSRDLVFVGGGHTHALVLRSWAMNPLPGVRVTLINPGPVAAYSGMLPGHIAGHYTRDQLDIDLVRLCRRAGARLIMAPATGIDAEARLIKVEGWPDVAYDVASVDVGITSAMPDLPGFSKHGMPAKPLGPFASRWAAFRKGSGPARVAVIGGGVAGAELAMAMAHALRTDGRMAEITLLDRGRALDMLGPVAQTRLRDALHDLRVTVRDNATPTRITAHAVELQGGEKIEADFITGAAGARPHAWLAQSTLADERGFIPVDSRLRSRVGTVYAVGDCAHMTDAPRPKAGVFAVRQAPVLFDNLRAALSGAGAQKPYRPQRDYLKLISLGEKSAMAERNGHVLSGPLLWRWKDWIDRRFMQKFETPDPALPPALPWPRAAGLSETVGAKPMCGGCGSKVGAGALRDALSVLPGDAPTDDAAILTTGDARQVISTDHLRAMVTDPVMMARIAAVHALGDIWAMGATPQAALDSIILPRQSPDLAARSLREITQAASEILDEAGARLVGGHSTLGPELTIGFTVTGLCERAPITQDGAQPGDALILTKPLGSGVLMAADMAGQARGADVAAALSVMAQPQGAAAELLKEAHAMTDVTGFGLAGHLQAICAASGVGADLDLKSIPLMQGALELARDGVRSTLYPQNKAAFPHIPEDPRTDLLFDPQTGGGLLACVGKGAKTCVKKLRAQGIEAAIIGQITDRAGVLDIS
ncbi:selenide, water dikinase SelD [Roseovarius aestuariivivens]|uniref:selenide, water dikinase SelD n=1 Tax=Roseovarius aestuariivivens TaxID=1888910 RepID=UPI00107FE0C5|nr:selenide, water dikinase SelD [Roseovarius aestuariivivens]